MQWNSLSEFLSMGGYGWYVWTSFGITALCMAWEVTALQRRYGRVRQAISGPSASDRKEPG